ncbi:MAG: hypothetical protein NT062_05590 [Proteobacteria bacterium]|nr:hypothetical protein [Pseudomonadota bacterium]
MQDLIKRYFWILGGLVVMTCAVFAAKATSSIVEAKFLGDAEKGPKVTPVAPSPSAPAPKATHTKDGTQLAARNIFCSDCTPAVETLVTKTDDGSIQQTQLPIVLLATNVGARPTDSYATIINTENQRQGSFGFRLAGKDLVGDKIPGATGKLLAVHYKYIDFENNGHTERLGLLGAAIEVAKPVAAVEEKPADENKDELQTAIDNGVKKIDDNNYEIDKSLVEKILANPMAVAKGARVVPSMKNGKTDGFKLYAIRPNSVYGKIGLTNGDTLNAVNGVVLDSADKGLEVYTKFREATTLEVEITRRGKPFQIKYQIK